MDSKGGVPTKRTRDLTLNDGRQVTASELLIFGVVDGPNIAFMEVDQYGNDILPSDYRDEDKAVPLPLPTTYGYLGEGTTYRYGE